jgi:antitoxin component YwqK of YwqJK toxin-antitoxin module
LKEQGFFKGSVKNGLWITWYESGNKKQEGAFFNGQMDGRWFFWDEDGLIENIQIYNLSVLITDRVIDND